MAWRWLAVLILLLTVAAVPLSTDAAAPRPPRTVNVTIAAGRFIPNRIVVDAGTIVRWFNADLLAWH